MNVIKVKHRLQATWIAHDDLNLTLERVSGVKLAMCTPDETVTEEDLGQYYVDVPMLNERSLLESYFHMKTSVQRRYWAALQKGVSFPSKNASHLDLVARMQSFKGISNLDTAYG